MKKVFALIACAGSGARAGLQYNKLLYKVNGKTIAEYTLDNFIEAQKQGVITDIIILCSETDKAGFEKIILNSTLHTPHSTLNIVTGGKTRAESVKNGLSYIKEKYNPDETAVVLICDGARPNCSVDIIKRCAESAALYGSGVAAVPVADTVKIVENGITSSTLDREKLYAAQTPQAFNFNLIFNAYQHAGSNAGKLTDDSAVLEKFGNPKTGIRLVSGSYDNYKITTAEDIKRFECEKTMKAYCHGDGVHADGERQAFAAPSGHSAALRVSTPSPMTISLSHETAADLRVGIGSDTHRLVQGRKLILGGVTIPHTLGLSGHSDADALVHSIIDALLSAASLRDIGFHFPDTDPAYKDADSMELLKKTANLLKENQIDIVNISSIIHAEKPKMNPYIPQMSENIATALNITKEQISISAKTGEGIGIVGGEKAIVCETACLTERRNGK